MQVQTFYSGVSSQLHIVLDIAKREALMNKLPKDACALIEEVASNAYQ